MLAEQEISDILSQFPPMIGAFAYGSGAVEQKGYNYRDESAKLPMVDFIFVVEDSLQWHSKNLDLNPHHYSPLIKFSPRQIKNIQENYGAEIWYNPLIPMKIPAFPDRLMKYGVISMNSFQKDLTTWKHLYVAGRLHKPVQKLQTTPQIDELLLQNQNNAFKTSLLLLPAEFSEVDLYQTIASLSYLGDPRMTFGENPNKISNLVSNVLPLYRSLYSPSRFASIHPPSVPLPSLLPSSSSPPFSSSSKIRVADRIGSFPREPTVL